MPPGRTSLPATSPTDPATERYASAEALERLDASYALWISGVRKLTPEDLKRPAGPAEGEYAASPMAGIVLHINREALHHGAEISLLRDLYLWRETGVS